MTTELTKAAQQALMACPFCGSTNIKVHSYSDAVINGEPDAFAQCHDCSVTGPNGKTDTEAAEAWNARMPSLQQIGPTAEYWGNLAQQKADADARRGVSMPVSYYTSSIVGTLLALTQRTAAQTERDTGPRVLREVFALCEDTVDKMTAESTEFSRGRAFEAKGIARAIGTWFQDEYCGQSHMGEPSLPAPQQATPASAPQSLLMRLAGIAAECSDPDTTDALDALIAATQQATPEPVGEPDTVPLDALHAAERERDYWKTRARAMLDHAEGTCWYWMGDGEDHLESLVSSLPVVIRADQLRELLARPAPSVPEGFDVQALTATGGGNKYPMIVVRDKSSQLGEDVYQDEHPVIYGLLSAWLAAAQANGGEHD